MAIPPGLYGRIAPKMGLALHDNIGITSSVIDPDCCSELKVLMLNSSQKRFDIKQDDTIA